MTDQLNSSHPAGQQEPDRRWSTRRKLLLWSACGFGIPLSWFLWTIFGWLPAIKVSPETTWLTEPLTNDGDVDYMSYVKDLHKQRGGTHQNNDRWVSFFKAERLREVVSSNPQQSLTTEEQDLLKTAPVYFDPAELYSDSLSNELSPTERQDLIWTFEQETLPQMRYMPWTASDDRATADAVAKSGEWYREFESTLAPVGALGFPTPAGNQLADGIGHILLEAVTCRRRAADRFLLRAANRFGEGDPLGGMRDVEFVSRAATSEHFCMIELQNQCYMETTLVRTAAAGLLSTPKLDEASISIIANLPTESLISIYVERLQSERLIRLDWLSRLHRLQQIGDKDMFDPKVETFIAWASARHRASRVNFGALMRYENKLMDEAVQIAQTEPWLSAHRQLGWLFDSSQKTTPKSGLPALNPWNHFKNQRHYEWLMTKGHTFILDGYRRAIETLLRRRALQLIARLVVWRQKHGKYPGRLSQLESLSEFPTTPDNLFIDPFTKQLLHYHSDGDRFELRSLGHNGTKDNGGWNEVNGEVTAPTGQEDDYIWSWPLPEDETDQP